MARLIIPAVFLLAIDLYFFQTVRTASVNLNQNIRLAIHLSYWLLTVASIVAIYFAGSRESLPNHTRYYIFSMVLVLLIPKLAGTIMLAIEDLFRIGSGIVGLFTSNDQPFIQDRRKFISQAGLITAAIPFTAMLYGMAKTAFDFTVRRKTLYSDDLPPAFDGLKIAQISDLHSGSFKSPEVISKAIDKILDQRPDIIFFTGDLVNNEASEAEPFINEFSRLKAPLGVYSILGNHDYGDYGPWPSAEAKRANLERLKSIHRESGWDVLLNEHRIIRKEGSEIALVGVENWGASRHFPKYGDLDKAVSGSEHIPFKILLSHDPSHWDAQVKNHPQKFDLTLSGHTHGFQFGIEIPGLKWSPVQYVYKQWAGLYKEGSQHLYVNRGLGFIGFMGRVGIAPEITVLEFKSNQNA